MTLYLKETQHFIKSCLYFAYTTPQIYQIKFFEDIFLCTIIKSGPATLAPSTYLPN